MQCRAENVLGVREVVHAVLLGPVVRKQDLPAQPCNGLLQTSVSALTMPDVKPTAWKIITLHITSDIID
jgi:hypothetical protein